MKACDIRGRRWWQWAHDGTFTRPLTSANGRVPWNIFFDAWRDIAAFYRERPASFIRGASRSTLAWDFSEWLKVIGPLGFILYIDKEFVRNVLNQAVELGWASKSQSPTGHTIFILNEVA